MFNKRFEYFERPSIMCSLSIRDIDRVFMLFMFNTIDDLSVLNLYSTPTKVW